MCLWYMVILLPQTAIQKNDWNENVLNLLWFYRQGGKDQTKKGPNIKLGPQGDKKGLGQDPRKDSSMDSGHHLKVQALDVYRQ